MHATHRRLHRFLWLGLWLLLPALGRAQELEVHVLNVDQGLSVFVRSPTGQRVLIDGGNPGDGTALVRPYLQSIGVTALDVSWMTHWHTDHFGGLIDLFNSTYKPLVAAYDRGDVNKPSNSFVTAYMSAVSGKRQIATLGQVYDLGGGATLTVAAINGTWPGGSVNPTQSSQEENSRSLAIVIRYGDFDCYVGGDCTANGDGSTSNVEGPATAVIGQVEVAVTAHHGSSTSSTSQVVGNLNPAMVISSAGLDNPYGHPTKSVTNRWNTPSAARVQWCTTDGDTGNGSGGFTSTNAAIVLTSDGSGFEARRSNSLDRVGFTTWEQPLPAAAVGQLVIGEAMVAPAGASDLYGEWWELHSLASSPISLAGMRMLSGANSFTVISPIVLAPDERFVVGVDGRRSRNGDLFVGLGAPWEQFSLADSTSSLSLRTSGNALIETVNWGGSGAAIVAGKSLERIFAQLPPSATNFAAALTAWAAGDLGTPGRANDHDPESCPDPVAFGIGKPTSVGTFPSISWAGTPSVYTNDLQITVTGAVPNKPGLVLYSPNTQTLPFYGGTLYVGAPLKRLPGLPFDATGFGSRDFPLTATDAGATYYFQWWFRDNQAPDGTKVGLSDALSVLICPSAVAPPPPGGGVVVISEILKDPSAVSDANGEWFELFNPSGQAVDIEGWTIRDDGIDSHVIQNSGQGVLVPAGGYLVLGINGNSGTNGNVNVGYVYSNFLLANGDDEVVLIDGSGQEVDRVNYLPSGWPSTPGRALSLDPGSLDVTGNDDPSNWCTASAVFGLGDFGTPGVQNTNCP